MIYVFFLAMMSLNLSASRGLIRQIPFAAFAVLGHKVSVYECHLIDPYTSKYLLTSRLGPRYVWGGPNTEPQQVFGGL